MRNSNPLPLSRGRIRAILAVVVLALVMVVSAVSGLNVALPDLARDTGASQRDLQWIVDAYTLVFAGLLLPAGALGDRYGRKGILIFGCAIFGFASASAMFVEDPTLLIALRALMGVGAAAVMPVTLSIITTSFPEERRAHAVGVWVGVVGGGAVVGLLGSGFLLEFFAWNSFFALNASLALVALVGAALVIPHARETERPRIDPIGALAWMAGVALLIFAIIEGPERGWTSTIVVAAFTIAVVSFVGFVTWELRRTSPMLDPRLFRIGGFRSGAVSLTTQFFAAFGFFFIALQYLQFVAGLSPFRAALAMLPMPLVVIPLARTVPAIMRHFAPNRVAACGLLMLATGLAILSLVDVNFVYWKFAIGLIFFAAGMALAGTPATTAIVASLPPEKQGVASAVNDTSRELGSALGIAVLGSVLNDRYRQGLDAADATLPPEMIEGAKQSIAFVAYGPLEQLGTQGAAFAAFAEEAFVSAASDALLVAAGTLVVVAILIGARRTPTRSS